MPQEVGYQQQRGPAQAVGLPSASEASFGGQVGQAISQFGATVHDVKLRAYQQQRQQTADQELADGAVRLAKARQQLDEARDSARANAAKRGAGHVDAMGKAADDTLATIGEGVTDDRVRRQLTTQAEEYKASFLGGEHAWQTATAARAGVQDLKTLGDMASARVRTSSDPASYGQETRALDDTVNGWSGIGEDDKVAVRRELHAQLAMAHGGRMLDTDPAGLIKTIDAGLYNDVLDAKQIDALRGEADASMRRDEAQQRADAAHQRAVQADALAAKGVDLDAGAGSAGDRVAMANAYAAAGDQSKAAEWRQKAVGFGAVQGSRDWTLPQLDRRITELTGKQSAGKLNAAEAGELSGLTDQRSATSGRLNQEGGALLQLQYATGKPLPPVDPHDPRSLRTRAATAAAAAQTHGRYTVEPLTPNELPMFRDLVRGGPTEKLAALDLIRGFGDPRAVAGAARQVGGADDGGFRIAATLSHDVARDVLMGGDALKANAALFNDAKAQAVFNTYYRGAMRWLPQDYQADLLAAAKGIYATRAQRGGEAKWDNARSAGLFAEAIEAAMGRTRSPDGKVRGGVLHRPQGIVVVPAGMAPDQMDRVFARATPDQYRAAAGGAVPLWADNHPISIADFKNKLLPTAVGGGRYGFRGPDGAFVTDGHGRQYTVDVKKLPRR